MINQTFVYKWFRNKVKIGVKNLFEFDILVFLFNPWLNVHFIYGVRVCCDKNIWHSWYKWLGIWQVLWWPGYCRWGREHLFHIQETKTWADCQSVLSLLLLLTSNSYVTCWSELLSLLGKKISKQNVIICLGFKSKIIFSPEYKHWISDSPV